MSSKGCLFSTHPFIEKVTLMKYRVIGCHLMVKCRASWKCFPSVFTQEHLKCKYSPWVVISHCNGFNTVVQIQSWHKCFANIVPLKSMRLSQFTPVKGMTVCTEDFFGIIILGLTASWAARAFNAIGPSHKKDFYWHTEEMYGGKERKKIKSLAVIQ